MKPNLFILCLVMGMGWGLYCWPSRLAGDTQVARAHGVAIARPDYVLGPGDQISLAVEGLEDEYNDKIFRIDGSGDVGLPLIGRVHAADMSAASFESALEAKLQPVLKNPQVVVTVVNFGSQPVSVLGCVNTPGIVQLQGHKTLFDVLSMAGGLAPEAGYIVRVTRPIEMGAIPLPNAHTGDDAKTSIASVKVRDIVGSPKESENILILPGDTVSVPKAGVVYAVGSLVKPGAFSLDENESLSALQVVSLAEGLLPASSLSKAKIIRMASDGGPRVEIPVNLSRLMSGKIADVPLHAQDILFVPASTAKKAGIKTLDVVAAAAGYTVVYGR